MNINKLIYATFLGLYLMKEDIPEFIQEYISKNPPPGNNVDTWLALVSIKNAPNFDEPALRSMVLKTLE